MQPGAALLRGELTRASFIPAIAEEWNAIIVENNLEPTWLTSILTDHFLKGSAGETAAGGNQGLIKPFGLLGEKRGLVSCELLSIFLIFK
jgi:hypothetical protein